MATTYYKQVVDLLRQHGFEFIRQGKGSHELWASAGQSIKVEGGRAPAHREAERRLPARVERWRRRRLARVAVATAAP